MEFDGTLINRMRGCKFAILGEPKEALLVIFHLIRPHANVYLVEGMAPVIARNTTAAFVVWPEHDPVRTEVLNAIEGEPLDFPVISFGLPAFDGMRVGFHYNNVSDPVKTAVVRALQQLLDTRPKLKRGAVRDVADRIDSVAANLEALRINSATDAIAELKAISEMLRGMNALANAPAADNLDEVVRKFLVMLGSLFDVVGSKRGAEVIVAGGVAGVLGPVGWPAASVFLVATAAFMGKDAFMAALGKFNNRGRTKRAARRPHDDEAPPTTPTFPFGEGFNTQPFNTPPRKRS